MGREQVKRTADPSEHKPGQVFDQDGRYRPAWPRFREFVAMISTAEFMRESGIHLTLDEVIERRKEFYRLAYQTNAREQAEGLKGALTPEEWVAESEDMCVWEGDKIMAVLRASLDTLPYHEVIRFDRPARRPADPAPDAWGVGDFMAANAAEDEARRTIPYRVTVGEVLLYHNHSPRQTLDEVLAGALEDFDPRGADDHAIWHGDRLIAVVRRGAGGVPELVRLDASPGEPTMPKLNRFRDITKNVAARTESRRPLLRSALTFNPPGPDGDGDPVTVQVLVTDVDAEGPLELQEAGWGNYVLSNYSVHFRIVN